MIKGKFKLKEIVKDSISKTLHMIVDGERKNNKFIYTVLDSHQNKGKLEEDWLEPTIQEDRFIFLAKYNENLDRKKLTIMDLFDEKKDIKVTSNLVNTQMARVFEDTANKMESLSEHNECYIDMKVASVKPQEEHLCGAPACVGGWLCILFKKTEEDLFTTSTEKFVYYKKGAKEFAKKLGFENGAELQDWAKENPQIWGNECGGFMFCNGIAYIETDTGRTVTNDNITIKDIIHKWRCVAKRLREREEV